MVYVVADNNLDGYAPLDFEEISRVGSDANINVVAQIDRAGDSEGWTNTRRFLIRPGDKIDASPLENLGEQNMGDPETLKDFVNWGAQNFPADRTALIIWNHGSGWRNAQVNNAPGGGHKYVASDDSDGDALYNSEVVDALRATGENIDLIGFDACLMSTIETWYGLANLAAVGVGSQDLEPGTGWFYDRFLSNLKKDPAASPEQLARWIVSSYKEGYEELGEITQVAESYTLAAIDLKEVKKLSTTLSEISPKLLADFNDVDAVRDGLTPFHIPDSDWPHLVDVKKLFDELHGMNPQREYKSISKALDNVVFASVRSEDRVDQGSAGISIYFPRTMEWYQADPFGDAYRKSNEAYPVAFVQDVSWADFLQEYLKKKPH
ncbi:clostripain-related cysteine peptidase [Rhizobium sophoriradicis]|uniref:clostripain-related cysteine peptidase n=1 Tax=Rhizobium sophoriradicis TaxID=1535245 RepID=UPI0015CE33D2|nr:clostripain-related cysteine peptidase [Rhizobium sophoriradicis]